jgi:hypothetical protein
VWVPLDAEETFEPVRGFARRIAEAVVARVPESFTVALRTDQRGDRVLIDYLRSAYGQTSVPPYAVRARPAAPVGRHPAGLGRAGPDRAEGLPGWQPVPAAGPEAGPLAGHGPARPAAAGVRAPATGLGPAVPDKLVYPAHDYGPELFRQPWSNDHPG